VTVEVDDEVLPASRLQDFTEHVFTSWGCSRPMPRCWPTTSCGPSCGASRRWACGRSRSTRPACGWAGPSRGASCSSRGGVVGGGRRPGHLRSGGWGPGHADGRGHGPGRRGRRGGRAQHDVGRGAGLLRQRRRRPGHDRAGDQQQPAGHGAGWRGGGGAGCPGVRGRQSHRRFEAVAAAGHVDLEDEPLPTPRVPAAGRAVA
jgi:hypothetical protein